MTIIAKTKRFFMGALVGALFQQLLNETKMEQWVKLGYDSESGHQFFVPMLFYVFLFNRLAWGNLLDTNPVMAM